MSRLFITTAVPENHDKELKITFRNNQNSQHTLELTQDVCCHGFILSESLQFMDHFQYISNSESVNASLLKLMEATFQRRAGKLKREQNGVQGDGVEEPSYILLWAAGGDISHLYNENIKPLVRGSLGRPHGAVSQCFWMFQSDMNAYKKHHEVQILDLVWFESCIDPHVNEQGEECMHCSVSIPKESMEMKQKLRKLRREWHYNIEDRSNRMCNMVNSHMQYR